MGCLARSATMPDWDLIGTRQVTEDFLLQQLKQGSPGKKMGQGRVKRGLDGKLKEEARLDM